MQRFLLGGQCFSSGLDLARLSIIWIKIFLRHVQAGKSPIQSPAVAVTTAKIIDWLNWLECPTHEKDHQEYLQHQGLQGQEYHPPHQTCLVQHNSPAPKPLPSAACSQRP